MTDDRDNVISLADRRAARARSAGGAFVEFPISSAPSGPCEHREHHAGKNSRHWCRSCGRRWWRSPRYPDGNDTA